MLLKDITNVFIGCQDAANPSIGGNQAPDMIIPSKGMLLKIEEKIEAFKFCLLS